MTDILIVDDDAASRELLSAFLQPFGFRISLAATAVEGVAQVARTPPAVALCDVHMPGANGLWLADQIRDLSPSTAIILATGDADVPPIESLRPGIIAYLVKPLDRALVLRAVEEGVRWASRTRAVPQHGRRMLGRGTS